MTMKRITALVVALFLLLPCAFADTWDCVCGRTGNTGNFCGKCGKSREEAMTAQTQGGAPDSGEELLSMRNARIGDTVTYGRYPQTADGTDMTPIEWLVLDVQGNRVLLLSRYGLDSKPYNMENKDVTWETCTLREWLNGEFLNKAFNTEEQTAIPAVDIDNGMEQGCGWSTSGGNDTKDKVFLLSYAEAIRYMGLTWEDSNNMKPRVAPTAYAVKNGAYTKDGDETADGALTGFWWLRSPGNEQDIAAAVSTRGSLCVGGVYQSSGVVRPVLWIDLGSFTS